MHEMTRDEWWSFAGSGTLTGKLGVVRADGSPHVTPVWFVLNEGPDGDEIIFNTGADTVKGKALRRDPRISFAVDNQTPPYSYVQFTAEATLSEDVDEMLPWATAIGGRYMGEDNAEVFGKRNAVAGELLVRARITKVVAHAELAD
ncbi:PPOX class F420-dependent enzyme [Prauserella marina]|uniref:PPOX class probable F420-dependent enzyme n=1 Tax=Prauserella marina TaxID=530584 RepID=A0A222VZU3_9PSEU|nr:PPOX class F420-dependent oxidoreductase [Prauserella marina]ASR39478.1 PPOX class F420-dependent enzyme [Prauserella marina]PWV80204.1 PPOX class probable F420-dependent enzyme [Prauserella marina]SDD49434.1 PPOX class probable F420-dependent enzyme [Prauserella marina]